jgi:ketosteroid isomerase-like protein
MGEQAKVAALRPVYESWARGDFSPVFDVYSEGMEWGFSDEWPDLEGVSPDPSRRSERLAKFLEPWRGWRCDAEEFIAAGDVVVVVTRYTGHAKSSGFDMDTPGAHVWTFREGKVVRLEVFATRERALAVAGIER